MGRWCLWTRWRRLCWGLRRMCWMLLWLRRRICRLRLRERRRGRGRDCRCCRGGRLRSAGWRIVWRWRFRGRFGLGGCGSLRRCAGICPRRGVSLRPLSVYAVYSRLLTLSSTISLFFFSISCLRAASGDAAAELSPPSAGFSSGFWASVDCHRRERYCDAVDCDARIELVLSDEYGDEGICWIRDDCLIA